MNYKKNAIDLKPGTKIKIPFKGKPQEFVVLGVNCNRDNLDESIEFIDIMSTRTLLKGINFENKIPRYLNYHESNLKKELEAQKQYFPQEIQDIIIPRTVKCTSEFSENKNGDIKYLNIGDIWVPSITEVFGDDKLLDDFPEGVQYPYFENPKNRKVKGFWWTRSTRVFFNCYSYLVDRLGNCGCGYVFNKYNSVLCLRLKIN